MEREAREKEGEYGAVVRGAQRVGQKEGKKSGQKDDMKEMRGLMREVQYERDERIDEIRTT
jgi:hypothetical protein